MAEEKDFSHESVQDRDSIVKYLAALAEGIQQGKLLLASNGERLSLETANLVKLDVQARQKRDRGQLVLKMSWKHPRGGHDLRVEPLRIETDQADGKA